MKILIVSHLWPRSDWHHLGVFVSDQVDALSKKCDVSVAVPVDRTIWWSELTGGQLLSGLSRYRHRTHPTLLSSSYVKPVCIYYRTWFFRKIFAVHTARKLADALRKAPFDHVDLVHAHTVFPDGLACALWLENKTTPLVVTAHGSDVHSMSGGVKRSLAPLLRRAGALVPVSRFLADQLLKLGAPPDKITVIPNGFPAAPFTGQNNVQRNPKKVAYLGRLGPPKRVELLISALARCRDDIVLDIAGDGPWRRKYEALVRELDLEDRVRFLGMISHEDVPLFLAQAALMCLVSSKEGWPTVIFEALACGTPVLATAVGGVPEALEDPRLGTLVPADVSPERFAAQIEAALDSDWDHQFIKAFAFQHSWDELTDKLMALYQNLLAGKLPDASDNLPLPGS